MTGLTSNPTIFERAIRNSPPMTSRFATSIAEGKSGEALFFDLALEDITRAAGPVPSDPRTDQYRRRLGLSGGVAVAGL